MPPPAAGPPAAAGGSGGASGTPRPPAPPATTGSSAASSKSGSGRKSSNRSSSTSRGGGAGQQLGNAGQRAAKAPIFRRGQQAAISGGSILTGLIAYAIGVNYLQHGWPGVTAWLKAKLMNETAQQGNGIPAMYFHTGAGAAGGSTATQQAASPGPTHPAAPTPSGGNLYA